MHEPIKKIWVNDLPDTTMEPDGYDMKTVPTPSIRNMEILIEKINELVEANNKLREDLGDMWLNGGLGNNKG